VIVTLAEGSTKGHFTAASIAVVSTH
jgi:hypothetical protein